MRAPTSGSTASFTRTKQDPECRTRNRARSPRASHPTRPPPRRRRKPSPPQAKTRERASESASPHREERKNAAPRARRGEEESQPDPSEDTVVVLDDLEGSLEDAINATIVEFDDGSLVKGTVVKIDSDEVLLDIGFKSEGVIPTKELSIRNDVDPHEVVSLGEEVEALVLQKEDKDGRLILSKKRAQYEKAWGTIEAKKEADEVVSGPVIEVVKGGLIIDIGLRGFLPASLVDLRRVRDLHPFVGKVLECKIIELDKNRNNVVLSRRAYLEETQREQRDEFLTNLKPGEIRKGTVSSVVNFGAFVDLGGMDGLVHVSELSWKHVDHPSSVVQVGDEVTVQVLDVDLSRERISLSLKATQQDPWQEFAGGHQVGELVYGRVTKLVPFGAFVQVGEGIEGLVHISEMAEEHVEAPEQVVTPAKSSGSRSSTSISTAGGSRCRSSRPPRAARSRPSTASSTASTPTTSRATTSGPSSRPPADALRAEGGAHADGESAAATPAEASRSAVRRDAGDARPGTTGEAEECAPALSVPVVSGVTARPIGLFFDLTLERARPRPIVT